VNDELLGQLFRELMDYHVDPECFSLILEEFRKSGLMGVLSGVLVEYTSPVLSGKLSREWLDKTLSSMGVYEKYLVFKGARQEGLVIPVFDTWLQALIFVASLNPGGENLVVILTAYLDVLGDSYTLDGGLYADFSSAYEFLITCSGA
jgi:hypothetical protein